jgi:hypothetical protein
MGIVRVSARVEGSREIDDQREEKRRAFWGLWESGGNEIPTATTKGGHFHPFWQGTRARDGKSVSSGWNVHVCYHRKRSLLSGRHELSTMGSLLKNIRSHRCALPSSGLAPHPQMALPYIYPRR